MQTEKRRQADRQTEKEKDRQTDRERERAILSEFKDGTDMGDLIGHNTMYDFYIM